MSNRMQPAMDRVTPAPVRYHGLDAARAIALMLGITLHAACSFIPGFRAWAIIDVEAGPVPALIVYVIHIFRMELFFLMAGFFGRLVRERKGLGYFVKDRARRILIPLVAGWLLIFPMLIVGWVWGAFRARSVPKESGGSISLGHLWFLYYLLLIYVIVLAAQALLRSARLRAIADSCIRFTVAHPFGLVAPTVHCGVVLYLSGSWPALPNPENLKPEPGALLVYGGYFACGWLLHRQPELLDVLTRRWRWHLPAAAVVTVPLIAALGAESQRPLPDWARLAYFLAYALAIWLWTAGFTGACLRFLSQPSRTWRYLSDSSYWLYLLHLPLIVFLQVAIFDWMLGWPLKLLLIHVAVISPLLISYHFLVRPTWIGAILNGRRYPLRPDADRFGDQSTSGSPA